MKRRLTEPFGKAGLIVAAIALIFALTGGALAATGNNPLASSSKAKQGKPGKRGPKGPKGDTGATGTAGTNGTNGKDGAAGIQGEKGADGTDGTSPAGTPFTGSKTVGSVTCTEGGTEYKGATTNLVCNGKKGTEGSPWTNGGTLPEGATLTGAFTAPEGGEVTSYVPISFGVRLANPPTPVVVEGGEDKSAEGCSGTVSESGDFQGVPVANSGKLCIYVAISEQFKTGVDVTVLQPSQAAPSAGASVSGALLKAENLGIPTPVHGMWAVGGDTAP